MTTGPARTHLDMADWLTEIHSHYGPDHLVSRSIVNATPASPRRSR